MNKNYENFIDHLLELTCDREHSKTSTLYDKSITISFDGLSCEIPFNALNYLSLTNPLCELGYNKKYHHILNELIFDLMGLEEGLFNIRESMTSYTNSQELQELCQDFIHLQEEQAIKQKTLKTLVGNDKEYNNIIKKIRNLVEED